MTRIKALAVLAAVALLACANDASAAFTPSPAAARKALKGAAGKLINNGWVFVDGKYIPPPYKVLRAGTVIKINDVQVTRELIPWNEFVKTQPGAKAVRTGGEAAESGAEESPAASEPEPDFSSSDDDWESSLDDLFDDDPSPKKSSGGSSGSGYKIKPKKPAVTVTYTLEGEFVPNAKSNALLEKINSARTKIDANLRSGSCYFFSSRYAMVTVDPGGTKMMVERLPDIMKGSEDKAALLQGARSAGMAFITAPIAADLFKNRRDYLLLMQRNKEKKDRTWTKK